MEWSNQLNELRCLPFPSTGKVYEKRKPRKVPPWEIRSAYPLRGNIWEYLYDEQSDAGKRRPAKCNCRQKGKRTTGKTSTVFFAALLIATGVITSIWLNNSPKISLLANSLTKENLVSLLNMATPSFPEECCHRLRYLAAELSRVEQALRQSKRVRRSIMTTQLMKTDNSETDKRYITGITVSRGSDTTEYGGRVALWGVVPLWRAAPPPATVLKLRKPTPSDCWPFAGSYGEILMELPSYTQVRSLSVEHIRPDTARSAPKHFVLYGILHNGTLLKAVEGEYTNRGPAKQYFTLHHYSSLKKFLFRVLSNQGNHKYTCLYRVHVYRN